MDTHGQTVGLFLYLCCQLISYVFMVNFHVERRCCGLEHGDGISNNNKKGYIPNREGKMPSTLLGSTPIHTHRDTHIYALFIHPSETNDIQTRTGLLLLLISHSRTNRKTTPVSACWKTEWKMPHPEPNHQTLYTASKYTSCSSVCFCWPVKSGGGGDDSWICLEKFLASVFQDDCPLGHEPEGNDRFCSE